MEKRVVVFLILSLVIIIGYDYVLKQAGIMPPAQPDQAPTLDAPAQKDREPATTALNEPLKERAPTATPRTDSGASAPIAPASDEQTQEVATDLFRAIFTNRGAVLTSWELKRYTTTDKDRPQPIQMVYQGGKFRKPLSLQATDPALTTRMNEGLYDVQRDFSALDAAHPVGHVTFTYADPHSGLRAVKELTFHHDSYVVDIHVRTEGVQGPVDVVLGTNFGIVEWGEGFIGLIGPATKIDDHIIKDAPDAEVIRNGAVGWVALQDKYFLSVLIPNGSSSAVIKKEGDKIFSAGVRYAAGQGTRSSRRLESVPRTNFRDGLSLCISPHFSPTERRY